MFTTEFRTARENPKLSAVLLFLALLMMLASSCDGDPTEIPSANPTPAAGPIATAEPSPAATFAPQATTTPSPIATTPVTTPTRTSVPTATPTPLPTATLTPVPANPALGWPDVKIGSDTAWDAVFATLSAPEQSCIRNALGDELEWVLSKAVSAEGGNFNDWQVPIYRCLDPEIARAVFLSATRASSERYGEWSEGEFSCMKEWVSDVNVAELIASPDNSTEWAGFLTSLTSCVPDLLISAYISRWDLSLEELSEEEASCLRGKAESVDVTVFVTPIGDPAEEEFMASLASCLPDLLVSAYISLWGLSLQELSEEEASCLRGKVENIDVAALVTTSDDSAEEEFMAGLASCLPYIPVRIMLSAMEKSLDDLTEEELSCLREQKHDIGLWDGPETHEEEAEYVEAIASQFYCIPDVFIFMMIEGLGG